MVKFCKDLTEEKCKITDFFLQRIQELYKNFVCVLLMRCKKTKQNTLALAQVTKMPRTQYSQSSQFCFWFVSR